MTGAFNRVFLLKFDNGAEAAVHIPFPIVGNVGLSVASEVATMRYVQERWRGTAFKDAPLPPSVFAWSTSHDNPAGTPYIILEYSPGVRLLDRWPHIQRDDTAAALKSIGSLETALLLEQFSQNGSIYSAGDVPEELRRRPLYQGDDDSLEDFARQLAPQYKIGPTVDREWWRGPYGSIDADRGPWPDMQSMIRSAANFQLRALDTGAIDLASSKVRSTPSDIPLLRRMLHMCIRIAPFVVPSDPALTAPTLNHPDLSLTNLIVPPDGPATIRHSIDWQGATVSPFCMQVSLPPAVAYTADVIQLPRDGSEPSLPPDFDARTPEEQEHIRLHLRYANRHNWYVIFAYAVHAGRAAVWSLPHGSSLAGLVTCITRCVADGPVNLQRILIEFQRIWPAIAADQPGSTPCPIDFTPEEIASHDQEVQRWEEYERNVAQLCEEIGCQNDGSVHADDYEAAKVRMERLRDEWDEIVMKGPFPFFEGAYCYHLT
ncbi:hypothetical protein BN946_scf185042.g15 [Trametes cinnabarina]|uniref:Altered inheritance of mitochondria protein 9, mitochondrial n=1 Tax=Pycnoporus cinnabarinus TaxID=5643 RepID=A0A060S9P5_PYCCI|nr:hypothetical protein BN946_scf185042.g15 [Trametes cinnabarina]